MEGHQFLKFPFALRQKLVDIHRDRSHVSFLDLAKLKVSLTDQTQSHLKVIDRGARGMAHWASPMQGYSLRAAKMMAIGAA
jgi:hypothetical protein